MLCAIDIETAAIPKMAAELEPIKAPANWKDEKKISAYIAEKSLKQEAEMALNPNYGRIISWAIAGDFPTICVCDEDEATLLHKLWGELERCQTFATFNGAGFDIPFLLRRSWYMHVKPTTKFELWKPWVPHGNHFDLRLILHDGDRMAKGSLAFYAKQKLWEETIGDGSTVGAWWFGRDYDSIREHNITDAELTYKLYKSMEGYYFG
jgi:predicted PolB exonuclease-like 3'-5' exonuclease